MLILVQGWFGNHRPLPSLMFNLLTLMLHPTLIGTMLMSLFFLKHFLYFLQIFKVAQNLGQSPCTIIVQGCWPKCQGENSPFLIHFLICI